LSTLWGISAQGGAPTADASGCRIVDLHRSESCAIAPLLLLVLLPPYGLVDREEHREPAGNEHGRTVGNTTTA